MFKRGFPKLYSEQEHDLIEAHIKKYFGEYDSTFHELISPDIHLDVCKIPPSPERNHYTLVTLGAGAMPMKVPRGYRKHVCDRIELLITLPPDWEFSSNEEKWYWPIGLLKRLGRLPIENKTWLGYGHTIEDHAPFAENTELCASMISMPYFFGNKASVCRLPKKRNVGFYQVIPLYKSEMNYKLQNDAESLESLFPEDFSMVVDISRKNVV